MRNAISMSKTQQAKDDVASVTEGNSVTINALANDLGGIANSLYSLNQSNPLVSSTTATLASGAVVSIVNGKIIYDLNGAFESLGARATATDTFTYAIRLGDGTVSTAKATVTVTGQNDPALIGGTDTGSVTEDGTLTTGGTLTITDADAGEGVFQAVDPAALDTTYGAFTFNKTTRAWTYALDNTAAQALGAGDSVQEVLRVRSQDGTTHDITVTINGGNNDFISTSANETFVGTDGEVDYFYFNFANSHGSDIIQNIDTEDHIFMPFSPLRASLGLSLTDSRFNVGPATITLSDGNDFFELMVSGIPDDDGTGFHGVLNARYSYDGTVTTASIDYLDASVLHLNAGAGLI
jgi:VCBS repeat-containing protein